MVQEFKDYDKKYSAYKGKLMDYEQALGDAFDLSAADKIDCWGLDVQSYTNAAIRQAVYFGEGAEEWQKFRVSLKGFNTRQKLYRLLVRLDVFKDDNVEKLRVDNYIGALVRGGQLNTKLGVVR